MAESSQAFSALAKMPQTEFSLVRTIESLRSETDPARKQQLEQVLFDLRIGLMTRFGDLVERACEQSPKLAEHVCKRTQLASLTADVQWEQLIELATSGADAEQAWRLVEALSHNPQSAGWAISTLNDQASTDSMRCFAIDLLGSLRFRQAAEMIFDRLCASTATESLVRSCIESLVKIGSAQTCERLAQRFGTMPLQARPAAAEILSRIKLPQSESAAFASFQSEADPATRSRLARTLCDLATTLPAALSSLGQIIEQGDSPGDDPNLVADLEALFAMIGRPVPRVVAETAAPKANPFFSKSSKPTARVKMPVTVETPAAKPAVRPPVAPLKRPAGRVGRNDPCSCGSGKKYKKCCGK